MSNTAKAGNAFCHWSLLLAPIVFGTGVLMAALTLVLVTLVSVKEAHGAEDGLKEFVDGNPDRTKVLFTVKSETFLPPDYTTVAGAVSAGCLMLGGLMSLFLLIPFFQASSAAVGTGRYEARNCGYESSSAHQPLVTGDIPNPHHHDIPTLGKKVRPRTASSPTAAALGSAESVEVPRSGTFSTPAAGFIPFTPRESRQCSVTSWPTHDS